MIQLRSDCLVFSFSDEAIPCSAEAVAVELVGNSTGETDVDTIRHAAMGVLHFFRHVLGQEFVTVAEFGGLLRRVLRQLGFEVQFPDTVPDEPVGVEVDLPTLAQEAGTGFELAFFRRLRTEMRLRLLASAGPGSVPGKLPLLRLVGLRACTKQLVGARRWSRRCGAVSDQIVEFARRCLLEATPRGALVVV